MTKLVKIISLIFVFVTVFTCFGCGVDENSVTLDINEKSAELLSLASFDDNLTEINKLILTTIMGDIAPITDAKVYRGESGATAEEFFLIYCDDVENVEYVKTVLTEYAESQISGFEYYNPTEVPKLKDAVIISRGHYILFCVAKDSSALSAAFEGYFKG